MFHSPLSLSLVALCLCLPLAKAEQSSSSKASKTTKLAQKDKTTPPNIIFVLVDDMGWGDLGAFYQKERGKENNPAKPAFLTPHLDSLAESGVQLRQHYTAAPVCAPARASLLLGVHQGHARTVRDNTFDYPIENTPTLGSVLKAAGYKTAVIGKWGVGGGPESSGSLAESSAHPTKRGFDYFFGFMDHISGHCHYPTTDPQFGPDKKNAIFLVEKGKEKEISQLCTGAYSTDLFTAQAKKWITEQHKESPQKPFFLYLAFTAPHAALQVPTGPYPKGGGLKGGVQWQGEKEPIINTALKDKKDSFIYPEYANATYDHDNNPATAPVAWTPAAKRHATMIRRVDDALADVETLLKDLGIDKNTLIVFTSDNGPHTEAGAFGRFQQDPSFFRSYGPFDGVKRDCWEGGVRVPTLFKWPQRGLKNVVVERPSQFQDWMATLADAAGIAPPALSDGVSLLPSLTGEGTQKDSTIYSEYCHPGKTPSYKDFDKSHLIERSQEQIVFLDGYKGVRYNIKSAQDDFRIFDVKKDPQELHNLAGSPELPKDLNARMKEHVLQLRRPYVYAHEKRGKAGSLNRPYDKEAIPALRELTTKGLKAGLLCQRAFSNTPWVADFDALSPKSPLKPVEKISFPAKAYGKQTTVSFSGYLEVPETGTYSFSLTTDKNAGSKALVFLHKAQLIDADNDYESGTPRDSYPAVATTERKEKAPKDPSVVLEKGLHPITILYQTEGKAPSSLSLEWTTPLESTLKPIPANKWYSRPQ